jgi:hypothetical protein
MKTPLQQQCTQNFKWMIHSASKSIHQLIYRFALLRVIRVPSAAGLALIFCTFAGGGFVRVALGGSFTTAALCGDTLADFDLERDCKQSTDQCARKMHKLRTFCGDSGTTLSLPLVVC